VRKKRGPNPRGISRRDLLRTLGGTALVSLPALAHAGPLVTVVSNAQLQATKAAHAATQGQTAASQAASIPSPLSPDLPRASYLSPTDEAFLEQMQKAIFGFFWEQTNPATGIIKDRCNVRGIDNGILGSIASTGFGLSAICIGTKRGYVSANQARQRVLNTLRFLWRKLAHEHGFFYHWANINSGERMWNAEISSVDTALLLCGILTCRQYFQHTEISELAHEIFNRVDWQWLSEDTKILPHGWTPEHGFLQYRWDSYSEMMMMYLLGMGSSTHPLGADSWNAWKRTEFDFDGIKYIGSYAPLFVHQFSQAWFDFRGKRDAYADYFQNSILATEVHKRFCISLANKFPDYSDDLWGITASDSANGYQIWGGPPATGPIDGTVVPCASAGSLPFMPGPVMRVLRTINTRFGAGTWSRYGFVDAFNPGTNWYDSDVVGIDSGIMIIMAENARTGFIWDTFMKNPEAQRGMERAGFKPVQPLAPQELVEMHLRSQA
jgi:hypothetical protein